MAEWELGYSYKWSPFFGSPKEVFRKVFKRETWRLYSSGQKWKNEYLRYSFKYSRSGNFRHFDEVWFHTDNTETHMISISETLTNDEINRKYKRLKPDLDQIFYVIPFFPMVFVSLVLIENFILGTLATMPFALAYLFSFNNWVEPLFNPRKNKIILNQLENRFSDLPDQYQNHKYLAFDMYKIGRFASVTLDNSLMKNFCNVLEGSIYFQTSVSQPEHSQFDLSSEVIRPGDSGLAVLLEPSGVEEPPVDPPQVPRKTFPNSLSPDGKPGTQQIEPGVTDQKHYMTRPIQGL